MTEYINFGDNRQAEAEDLSAWAGLYGMSWDEASERMFNRTSYESMLTEDREYTRLARRERLAVLRIQQMEQRVSMVTARLQEVERSVSEYPRFGSFYGLLVLAGLAISLVFGYTLLTYWMTITLWPLAVLVVAGSVITLIVWQRSSIDETTSLSVSPYMLLMLGLTLWLVADGWLNHRTWHDILRLAVSGIPFLLAIAGIRRWMNRQVRMGIPPVSRRVMLLLRLITTRLCRTVQAGRLRRLQVLHNRYRHSREQRGLIIRNRWNISQQQLYGIWRRGTTMRNILDDESRDVPTSDLSGVPFSNGFN